MGSYIFPKAINDLQNANVAILFCTKVPTPKWMTNAYRVVGAKTRKARRSKSLKLLRSIVDVLFSQMSYRDVMVSRTC